MLSSIFKSYDIRGLAPKEIKPADAHQLGVTLAALYRPKQVLVGQDMRTTSAELEAALVEGFISQGVDVVRVGLCSTPMFYFAVGEGAGSYELGVMVTASHNPAQYNGFKLVKGDVQPIGQGSGMEEIRDAACTNASEAPRPPKGGVSEDKFWQNPFQGAGGSVGGRGKVEDDDEVRARYLDRVFHLAALPRDLPSWSVAIDAGNGMNGFILPEFVKRLPTLKIEPLYWELDGSFPNHEANPLKTETLTELRKTVINTGCALGFAFDGDGDRVGFVDEEGTPIPGDLLTALLARELLQECGTGRILYDLRSSWSVPEVIRENGGEPAMCRVGHAHIKKQMQAEQAMFAGELSMHFYFAEFWYAESSDYAVLLLLKLMAREGKPLSQLWRPLQRYAHSGELNFQVRDTPATLTKLDEIYAAKASARSTLDGLRFEFRDTNLPKQDWWFNVRASNTEPVLRLNLEARTQSQMEARKLELTDILRA